MPLEMTKGCEHSVSEMDVAAQADGICPLCQWEEAARLRKGIQDYLDGNYGFDYGGSKVNKCPHGAYRHEICEGCIDEHFTSLLGS